MASLGKIKPAIGPLGPLFVRKNQHHRETALGHFAQKGTGSLLLYSSASSGASPDPPGPSPHPGPRRCAPVPASHVGCPASSRAARQLPLRSGRARRCARSAPFALRQTRRALPIRTGPRLRVQRAGAVTFSDKCGVTM